jgi:hypothetical protein
MKKRKFCGQREAQEQSPRPGGIEVLKKKHTQVKLPKLYKEACPDCGDLNIFFDGVMKIEYKNC